MRLGSKWLVTALVMCAVLAAAAGMGAAGAGTGAAGAPEAPARGYIRVVTLSDLHLPGRNVANKVLVRNVINSWHDVDYVALLGDQVSDVGSEAEYLYASEFVRGFRAPVIPIVGNHDYIYLDKKNSVGGRERGAYMDRQAKLEQFRKAFGVEELYRSVEAGGYLLVFLSTDELYSSYLARMSEEQLGWFSAELEAHKHTPTIVFFHSPLKGTIAKGGNYVAVKADFWAQPVQAIHDILDDNRQVIAWVSGHTHTDPTNKNFYDPAVTMYDGRVLNVHTPETTGSGFLSEEDYDTIDHNSAWINSLYLYPGKVVIRTYDAINGVWLEHLDREIVMHSIAP